MKIVLIGTSWNEEEAMWKKPFIGSSGKQLDSLLEDAGLERKDIYTTCVFNLRSKLEDLCVEKKHPDAMSRWPALLPGLYLKREHAGELARLREELETIRPNLALLAGNTPCWALLERQGISKIRGTCTYSSRIPELKCLPIYDPGYILKQYSDRHVTVLDLVKAKREGDFPELIRPRREIWIKPDLEDIREFTRRFLEDATELAFDIETNRKGQITCISFAASIDRALVIPFFDDNEAKRNYWPTLRDELIAWDLVASILNLPAKKVGQNGLYDIQYLWQNYGIPVRNYDDDTMLLHHSLQPESEKGLGFLGSVYTNEPAWKVERPRGKETQKRDD